MLTAMRFPVVESDFTPQEFVRLAELVETKYDTDEWIFTLP